jgi:hypothetical protein
VIAELVKGPQPMQMLVCQVNTVRLFCCRLIRALSSLGAPLTCASRVSDEWRTRRQEGTLLQLARLQVVHLRTQ